MENETKKFAYNIRQWITLYRFLLEHFNYEEAKKAGVSKRAKELIVCLFTNICLNCFCKKNIVKVVSK